MTTSNEMNWDDFSKYVSDKKLDVLRQEGREMIVEEDYGYEDMSEEEKEKQFLHDSLYFCICILKLIKEKTGLSTYKLTERELERLGSIPFRIEELPNGDKYVTLE